MRFRVSAKRGDKTFPMTSPQLERELGARIVERFEPEFRQLMWLALMLPWAEPMR